jgi:DNA-binding MarR family transcriptional regulator
MKEHGEAINDFLGSAHVFAAAVTKVIEEELLREAVNNEITVSQLKLLKLVNISEARTIGDVAAFLGVSNAAASKAVDKLVRMMLLRRSEAEADRRSIHLSLTEPSRRMLAAYEAARQQKLRHLFGQFEEEELRRTTSFLDRLSVQIVGRRSNEGRLCLQCGIHFREKCVLYELLDRPCPFRPTKERNEP